MHLFYGIAGFVFPFNNVSYEVWPETQTYFLTSFAPLFFYIFKSEIIS